LSRDIIITCAVTGAAPVNPRYPADLVYPVTPEQIAQAAVDAAQAGAAIVHCHVRDPETGLHSRDPGLFRRLTDMVRDSGVDVILNLTGGVGGDFLPDEADENRPGPASDLANSHERMAHARLCRPDIMSIDLTTSNQPVPGASDGIYINTTRTTRAMAIEARELGIKPELECFEAGDAMFARHLIDEGLVAGPPMVQFVLGVKWNAPATPETVAYLKSLLPLDAVWTAMGVARAQMQIAAQSILLGGHVRVGLEDNLYLEHGVFATNAQLVERARTLIEVLGHRVATPSAARTILGLDPRV